MREFRDKVAVITGAASGIGFALAQACAREEMRVVLADFDAAALKITAEQLQSEGFDVIGVETDVSKAESVVALAKAALDAYGAVHLLFNNAGVGIVTPILESTYADWEWALGVNLWGVIHGVHVFAPIMKAQNEPCYIVNTASIAGLISPPGLGIYRTTKHAVVAFSEALYHELEEAAPQIGISVLCPGIVKTGIMRSSHRQAVEEKSASSGNAEEARLASAQAAGMDAETVAEITLDAVRESRFYVLTHPERNWQIKYRMENILSGRNPGAVLQQG